MRECTPKLLDLMGAKEAGRVEAQPGEELAVLK